MIEWLSDSASDGLIRADICAAEAECRLSCHLLVTQAEVRTCRSWHTYVCFPDWLLICNSPVVRSMQKCPICAPWLSVSCHAGQPALKAIAHCL